MIKISVSDGFSKSVDLNLDSTSISMITRFLQYMCYADHAIYKDSESLQKVVSEFYDSNYESSMLQDAKVLKDILDYSVNRLH